MRGIVEKTSYNSLKIIGEDGNHYTGYKSENMNSSHIVKGNIVTFDTNGLTFVSNIRKTGHGVNHPFAMDLLQAIDYVEATPESPDREYRLRDLRTMYNYFTHCEDYEWDKTPKATFIER